MRRNRATRPIPPAARVFSGLQAGEALLPSEASISRKGVAVLLALLMLGAVPLFWAANASGLIGDVPTATAKGKGASISGDDDDDEADDADRTFLRTDNTSRNNRDTRGTTRDRDTLTGPGTNDTSRNNRETRGTTRDRDTRTSPGTNDTSRNNRETRGTTRDRDTRTSPGTNDTSRRGHSTRGTTRDRDTRTNTRNSRTGTGTNGGTNT